MIKEIETTLVNNEIEQSVLCCLIQDSELSYQAEIKESYFMSQRNKAIYKTIQELTRLRKQIDLTMLIAELWADYMDYLLELSIKTRTTSWFTDYVQKLKEYRQHREIKQIWSLIDLSTVDRIDDVMATTYNKIWELMHLGKEEQTTDQALNNILDNAGNPASKIWLYWRKEIDSRTFWIKAWKFTIIMARPWVGKTLAAVNIMSNLMDQWVKSLMLSGEMLQEEVLQRFLSVRYKIPPYVFESKKGIEIMEMIGKSWVDDYAYIPENIRISDKALIDTIIYHQIYTAYHRENIKVVILDYIQLATTSQKSQNRAYEIGSISNKIKRICNELKISVIALAQISREWAKSGRIGLEHLKDCWELEQDADIVRSLDKDEDDKGRISEITISLLKNRWWWWLWDYRYKVDWAKITNNLLK